MDYQARQQQKEQASKEAALEAEMAINEEVRRFNLEFAELSITMRELLGKVYIRGGIETLKKIKNVGATIPPKTNEG